MLSKIPHSDIIGRKKYADWADKTLNGLALCSQCAPAEFSNGESSDYGVWHGKFPRVIANKDRILAHGFKQFVWTDALGEILG